MRASQTCWGAILWMTLSCRPPTPFYTNASLEIPPIPEDARSFLTQRLQRALDKGEISALVLNGAFIAPEEIEEMPLTSLAAAWGVLEDDQFVGAEWDFAVQLESGERRMVTTVWELDGTFSIFLGAAVPQAVAVASAGELQLRYGVGPFQDGDRRWAPVERGAVGAALALLTREERAVLKGMPFVREQQAPTRHVAHYVFRDGKTRILLYDRLFVQDGREFRGSLERPHQPSIFGIVHEFGHALANHPRVLLFHKRAKLIANYNSLVDEYNAAIEAIGNAQPQEQRRQVEAINALQVRLEATRGLIETLDAQYETMRTSPIIAAYVAQRGSQLGPTIYGRTSDEESFADAFALYHIDPAALQRVSPAVYTWMAAGGHLRTLDRAVQGILGPPQE